MRVRNISDSMIGLRKKGVPGIIPVPAYKKAAFDPDDETKQVAGEENLEVIVPDDVWEYNCTLPTFKIMLGSFQIIEDVASKKDEVKSEASKEDAESEIATPAKKKKTEINDFLK